MRKCNSLQCSWKMRKPAPGGLDLSGELVCCVEAISDLQRLLLLVCSRLRLHLGKTGSFFLSVTTAVSSGMQPSLS